MLEHFGVREDTWRDGIAQAPQFAVSETPRFVGRAIAALAADPRLRERSGRRYGSWHLAAEYDLRDVDGSRPDWGAHAVRQSFGPDQAGATCASARCTPHRVRTRASQTSKSTPTTSDRHEPTLRTEQGQILLSGTSYGGGPLVRP